MPFQQHLIGRGFFAQGLTFFNQTATSAVLVLAVPHSGRVATERIVGNPEDPNPYRICTGPAPAHGWNGTSLIFIA